MLKAVLVAKEGDGGTINKQTVFVYFVDSTGMLEQSMHLRCW